MPIYEYVCQSCGHEAEIMHKISDPPATDCPECSQPALSKLISAAGFRLSGGGWYETDFKSANKRNLANEGETKKDPAGETCKPSGCDKPACAAKPDPTPAAA
jgi:putative FmdB family regulatory protein